MIDDRLRSFDELFKKNGKNKERVPQLFESE